MQAGFAQETGRCLCPDTHDGTLLHSPVAEQGAGGQHRPCSEISGYTSAAGRTCSSDLRCRQFVVFEMRGRQGLTGHLNGTSAAKCCGLHTLVVLRWGRCWRALWGNLVPALPHWVWGGPLQNCTWVLLQSKVITAPRLGAREQAEI